MTTEVRVASAADADALFGLAAEFATTFRPHRDAFEDNFQRLLGEPDAVLLVAEAEHGRLRGYLLGFDHLTFFANGRVGWIEEMFVAAAARRRGVGRDLITRFEQWARRRDAALIALATRRAAAFYAAMGYDESAAYFRKLL